MTAASDTDTQRKLSELSFLREIAQLASSTRDWDEMLRIVIDRTTVALRAEVASLYLIEKREALLRLVATNGLDRRWIGKATLRLGEGITGWVANARVPLAVRDVRNEPRFKWVRAVDQERFTSMLSVPLVIRDEVIGVMNVQTVELREFERGEIDFLQTIANQVAGIIEKSRLQRDAERKLREVSALFEVSNVLTSTLELDEVLKLVVDRLVRVYPGASGGILLRDENGEPVLRASSGSLPRSALAAARTALAETRPVVEPDQVALPLIAGDRLVGAVALHVPGQTEFAETEVAFVGTLANQGRARHRQGVAVRARAQDVGAPARAGPRALRLRGGRHARSSDSALGRARVSRSLRPSRPAPRRTRTGSPCRWPRPPRRSSGSISWSTGSSRR